MKLTAENNLEPKTSISVEQEKEQKLKFQGRLLPKRGHTCFEYDYKTGELRPATFTKDSTTLIFNPKTGRAEDPKKRKIITNENCLYLTALNWKNAVKILRRDHSIVSDIIKAKKVEYVK